MPEYSFHDEVDALAVELQRLTKARSKTDAVRQALKHEIERSRAGIPFRERIARLQERAAGIGLPSRDFDVKKFTDEMWGDD